MKDRKSRSDIQSANGCHPPARGMGSPRLGSLRRYPQPRFHNISPEEAIAELAGCKQIVLYPSGCRERLCFAAMPYDGVVTNSMFPGKIHHRHYRNVFGLSLDNRELIGRMQAAGIQAEVLVLMRDGCEEGGNYECALRESFMARVLPVMKREFIYLHDNHGPEALDMPIETESIPIPDGLLPLISHSGPVYPPSALRVVQTPSQVSGRTPNNLLVRVIRDTIWRDVYQLDLLQRPRGGRPNPAMLPYLYHGLDTGSRVPAILHYCSNANGLEGILTYANDHQLARVGIIPDGLGVRARIWEFLCQWNAEYPRELNIYHLNRDDWGPLRAVLASNGAQREELSSRV